MGSFFIRTQILISTTGKFPPILRCRTPQFLDVHRVHLRHFGVLTPRLDENFHRRYTNVNAFLYVILKPNYTNTSACL